MSLPSVAMSSRIYPIRIVQLGSGLNLIEPRLRVASGCQEYPVHHTRADEEAPGECEAVGPTPQPGAPGVPFTTEVSAACVAGALQSPSPARLVLPRRLLMLKSRMT